MDKPGNQGFICVILFVCILGISSSNVTYYATDVDGQYTVTLSFPRDCCGGECRILEQRPSSTVFAIMSSMGSELGRDTSLRATFPPGNNTFINLKIGPVDKNTFRNDYVGVYTMQSNKCPNTSYLVEELITTTATTTTTPTTTTPTTTTPTTTAPTTTTTTPTTTMTTTTTPTTTTTTLTTTTPTTTTPTTTTTTPTTTTPTTTTTSPTTTIPTTTYKTTLSTLSAVTMSVDMMMCKRMVDDRGTVWDTTLPLEKQTLSCPESHIGNITRLCDENGEWQTAEYNCTKKVFSDIAKKLNDKNVTITETEIQDILETLGSETASKDAIQYDNDLSSVVDSLTKIGNFTKVSRENFSSAESLTDTFLQVANNIISENNSATWDTLQRKEGKGAENLINTVDAWTEKVSTVFTDNTPAIVQSKENLYFQMESVVDNSDIVFPNSQTNYTMEWMKQRMNRIVFPKLNDSLRNGKLPTAYSAMVYRNMSKLVADSFTKDEVNSAIVSFSVYPHATEKLDSPVSITLQVIDKSLVNPQCSFLDKSNRSGEFTRWSQDGCVTKPYKDTDDGVVCQCNHLTNFALLMSPVPQMEHLTAHVKTIGILSIVGCSISIACLFVTMVVYLFFWKKIRDNRTIILFNLFAMLLSAYIVFLAGVDKTTNQDLCTTISVSLHFLFSLVFLLMLAEGIAVLLVIIRPTDIRETGKYFVIASYVLGFVIVGVTMAASQLEGYGNDRYCWLTVESGLVWVFLGEVIVVIVINSAVMVRVLKELLISRSRGKKVDGKLWKAFRNICILMPIMGVTWLFGIFSINEDTLVFQYLFVIFNTFQGFLIFVCHCICNEKVKTAIKDWHKRLQQKRTTESDLRQHSSQQTTTFYL